MATRHRVLPTNSIHRYRWDGHVCFCIAGPDAGSIPTAGRRNVSAKYLDRFAGRTPRTADARGITLGRRTDLAACNSDHIGDSTIPAASDAGAIIGMTGSRHIAAIDQNRHAGTAPARPDAGRGNPAFRDDRTAGNPDIAGQDLGGIGLSGSGTARPDSRGIVAARRMHVSAGDGNVTAGRKERTANCGSFIIYSQQTKG